MGTTNERSKRCKETIKKVNEKENSSNHIEGIGLSLNEKKKITKEVKSITEEEAEKDYENLENLKIKDIKPSTRTGNKFIDFFTFFERLNTVGKNGLSFFDYFEERNKNIKKPYIKRLIEYMSKNKNIYKKWYSVFNLYQGSINIFKPVLAMEIYYKFKPHTVLDFTMGWGGRLVGACVLNVPKYIGIDLNKKLENPYKDMVKKVKELGTKTEIQLIFKDCLTVDYSKFKYDMVFTSPPYFNIELYSGTKKRDKEDWINNFYIPIFEKTYKYLQKGGLYILNVPVEIYENVCIKVFGKADKLYPLKIQSRSKDIDYKEYLYIWKK